MKIKVKHLFAIFTLIISLICTYTFCTNSAHAKSDSSKRPSKYEKDYRPNHNSSHNHRFVPRNALETEYLGSNCYKYRVGNVWGIYDETHGVIAYPQYDQIVATTTDFFVSKNGYWGVLSQLGETKIPIEWDSVKDIGTYYAVERNGLYGWVNGSGQIIQQPVYTYIDNINSFLFSVCTDDGCGSNPPASSACAAAERP